MRFMMILKSTPAFEARIDAGEPMNEAIHTEMSRYNAELVKAGALLAGEGLHTSARGGKVRFHGDGRISVTDGPFTEAKEIIAGYWIIQVKSKAEAIEWAKRIPNPDHEDHEVELRQVHDASDAVT